MNTLGVIIARFQSPYLHEGHKTLIESVKKSHNKTVIVLGVSPVLGSRKNPLDFHTREKMIKKEIAIKVILFKFKGFASERKFIRRSKHRGHGK